MAGLMPAPHTHWRGGVDTDNALVRVFVPGLPRPQGSHRIGRAGRTGRPLLLEANRHTRPWRAEIAHGVRAAMTRDGLTWLNGPISVQATFVLPKPQRPKHPYWVLTKPDLDKLARALLDGLTQGQVWHDDSQVVSVWAQKRYVTPDEAPGVHLTICVAV